MRRPAIFFLLAGVAAILASMIVYSTLKKKDEEMAKALAGTTPIVVAAHDIPVGAKIDPGAIKMVRWPRDGLPAGAITDSGSVIGNIARSEFVDNEPIVASRLVSSDKSSGVLPLMIPGDMRAMAVPVDEVSDIAGFILPYTKVDVLLSLTGSDKEAGRSKIILQDVPVLAVAQTVEHKDSPQPERVVTLLVSPDQAEALAVATTQGKLHLALRGYGDNGYVPTSGSNVRKVMGGGGDMGEVSEPVPVQQAPAPAPVRRPVRRVVRRYRPPPIEVLRDGRSRESVPLGSDGRALLSAMSAPSGPASPSDGASVGSPSLGEENNGTSGYGVEGMSSSDSGMGAAGAGVSMGGDSK